MRKSILIAALAAAHAILLAPGCNYSERDLDPTLKQFFVEDGAEAPQTTRFADAQAAAGARAEGMLFDQHFDGARLNSLGEEKLALMLADDDAIDPMVVYLDLDEKDARANPRRGAIAAFLKERGLRDDQVVVVFGDNPAARSPAAPHLLRMPRTESGEAISGGAGDVAGSGGDSAGGFYKPSDDAGSFGGHTK